MKRKIFLAILIIVFVLLLVTGYNYYFKVQYKVDKNLEEKYVSLNNSSYKNESHMLFSEAIEREELSQTEGSKGFEFVCKNGKTAETKEYKFSSPARAIAMEGGWSSTFVIDCEEYYYVFEFPGHPGNIYGPFYF
jgi:hypothetical protein